jgi:hypothetical protein
MATSTEIQTLIARFASQLEAAARKAALEEVVTTLGGTARVRAAQKRGRGRSDATAGTAATGGPIKPVTPGRRRSPDDVEQMGNALFDYVKANPGARGEQIATAMRSDVGTIRLPMRVLIQAKRIKTQGLKRGMQYFVAGAMPTAQAAKKTAGRRGKRK